MFKVPSIAVAPLVALLVAIPGLAGCVSVPSRPGASSSPAPTVSPEDLDPSTYQALSPRDFALWVKNPDANTGRKIVLYGVVTQFDTGTGQDSFRANAGAEAGDYAEGTIFYARDPSILSQVVAQDAVTIWCQGNGTETYKSTNNVEVTLPKFWINIIKDSGSTNPDQNGPPATTNP